MNKIGKPSAWPNKKRGERNKITTIRYNKGDITIDTREMLLKKSQEDYYKQLNANKIET